MSSPRDVWAVVPVKGFSAAKQRLAGAFPAPFREGLARVMLDDVLNCLLKVPELARVAVITSDPVATAFAEAKGVIVLPENGRSGHSEAINAAARHLVGRGVAGMLTMPGDIPAVAVDEVSALLRAHRDGRAFSIAPAHDGRGSNAILMTPPDLLPLTFGNDSFRPHLAAAMAAHANIHIHHCHGIGLDIDEPADIERFRASGAGTATLDYLMAHEGGARTERRQSDG